MTNIPAPVEITALIDTKNKIILDWSPKAGCTIMVKMFFRNMGLLEEALEYNSWIHEYRMHVFSKVHPITLDDLKSSQFYKVKFVRNPFHRAVSSYLHTMKYPVMHEPVKKALWRWNADISFKSFVNYLSKIDLHTCDPHYSLQKKDFETDFPKCFDEIIKIENLDHAIKELNTRKGFGFDLSGLTSSHHLEKNRDLMANVAKTKWNKLKNDIPWYLNFYTPALAEKVYHLYREDFEAYSYSKDDYLV
ncbi:MAG: sulfotransferase family protein [Bacteroidota bacterium]|nr:sulfotransferase family protein [Bacteroidota bacterium]